MKQAEKMNMFQKICSKKLEFSFLPNFESNKIYLLDSISIWPVCIAWGFHLVAETSYLHPLHQIFNRNRIWLLWPPASTSRTLPGKPRIRARIRRRRRRQNPTSSRHRRTPDKRVWAQRKRRGKGQWRCLPAGIWTRDLLFLGQFHGTKFKVNFSEVEWTLLLGRNMSGKFQVNFEEISADRNFTLNFCLMKLALT